MAYGYGGYGMPYQGYGYNNFGQMQQPQKQEVIRVKGQNGVDALQMPPNSSVIVMDETAPMIWFCQTDGAGYKTSTPFDIKPHKAAAPVDMTALEERISRLEGIINEQSNHATAAEKQQKSAK